MSTKALEVKRSRW